VTKTITIFLSFPIISCTTSPSKKNFSEEGSFLDRLKIKAQLKAQATQKVKATSIGKDRSDFIKESKPDNIALELKKYKKLLDDGLITPEDYYAKKKELLGL
jgi:hypothetical protein